MIDNVYLINLDRRPERFESAKLEISKSLILKKYQKISAIDGQKLTDQDLKPYVTGGGYHDIVTNRPTKGLYLSYGGAALAITYQKLLSKCDHNMLILEDDIIVHKNFDKLLAPSLSELPAGWDILYLGWYRSQHLKVVPISGHINRLDGQVNGTQAWMVNPNSAKKICDLFPISYQIDSEIYRSKNLVKYSTKMPIITRNLKHTSDIQSY